MNQTLFDLMKKRAVLFDGGLGTELMRHGLPLGTSPETWNVERPEVVQEIHASYFEAGSDAVSTNSFGGNRIKLAAHGLEGRVRELNSAAARLARRAAPAGKFVAGSMGPTGKFLQPQGEFTESEFEEAYGEQARALAEGGVDLLIIETQYDLKEALSALRGARREAPSLPVFVTLTFNKLPRGYFTLMGNTVSSSAEALEKEGALAVGANCTLNSEDMVGLVRAFREATKLPVIAQANAGKPELSGQGEVSYSQGLEDYVRFIPEMLKAGANVIGGCCGTDPGYIRKMAEFIKK
jgi:5-methyltetrahydrofolate--homocysteine methyltransferase